MTNKTLDEPVFRSRSGANDLAGWPVLAAEMLRDTVRTLLAPDSTARLVSSTLDGFEVSVDERRRVNRWLQANGEPLLDHINSLHRQEINWINGGPARFRFETVAGLLRMDPDHLRRLIARETGLEYRDGQVGKTPDHAERVEAARVMRAERARREREERVGRFEMDERSEVKVHLAMDFA